MVRTANLSLKLVAVGALGMSLSGVAAAQVNLRLPVPSFLLSAAPVFDADLPPAIASSVAADSPWKNWLYEPTPAGVGGKGTFAQSVQVYAHRDIVGIEPDRGIGDHIEARQVETAAGAYNDIPRFLQTLPGVQFDSDARNTFLVNGGNAMENLYVIDGVEVPNINHMSSAGSSGGFVSVVDTSAIASLDLHKQLYGSEYSGTLSSVLDLHTVTPDSDRRHGNVELGYAGAGFLLEQPIGEHGFLMTQVRHSVENYFTDNIGIGGAPAYGSLLSTGLFALDGRNTLRTLFMISSDKLNIAPNVLDPGDPGLVNSDYTGRRRTFAATWHRSTDRGSSDLQLSLSSVATSTVQTSDHDNPVTGVTVGMPVYGDHLLETPATVRYDEYREGDRFSVKAGAVLSLHPLNYQIDQAQGYPSPYSLDPTPVDASNVDTQRTPLNDAAYMEASVRAIGKLELQGGLRFEQWGINNSSAWMPRLGAKIPLGGRAFLFGGVGSYSEMPSLPVMLGVASNLSLKPIRNLQTQFGGTVVDHSGDRMTASVFGRNYSDYPVSAEFPTLSLADMIDPFGLPNLYMPMTSAGKGKVRGAEVEFASSTQRVFFAQANLTLQSVEHTALDGVWRRANYDMPVLFNTLGGLRMPHRQLLTARWSYHTGTPYTPFLLAQSIVQGREIFDLSQVNVDRGWSYARLDLRYEINLTLRGRTLKIFAGVENALNADNFYQYVLIPGQFIARGPYPLSQMSRYPDGGMTWSF